MAKNTHAAIGANLTTLAKLNAARLCLENQNDTGAGDFLDSIKPVERTGIAQLMTKARKAVSLGERATARHHIKNAVAMIHENVRIKRHGVMTQTLVESGIHTLARITDGGDNSEPERLCNTSLIQITDDAGKEFVLLAMELDGICADWLAFRKTHPNAK